MENLVKSNVVMLRDIKNKAVLFGENNYTINTKRRENHLLLNELKNDFIAYYSKLRVEKNKDKKEILKDTKKYISNKFELQNSNNKLLNPLWALFENLSYYYENNISCNLSNLDYRKFNNLISLFQKCNNEKLLNNFTLEIYGKKEIILKKGEINPFYGVISKNGIKTNFNCIEFYLNEKSKILKSITNNLEKTFNEIRDNTAKINANLELQKIA